MNMLNKLHPFIRDSSSALLSKGGRFYEDIISGIESGKNLLVKSDPAVRRQNAFAIGVMQKCLA